MQLEAKQVKAQIDPQRNKNFKSEMYKVNPILFIEMLTNWPIH